MRVTEKVLLLHVHRLLLLVARKQLLQQWKDAPLPEAVAAIDQLVGPAVEATLHPTLTLNCPMQQAIQIKGL
jgi:hypothetical protein